MAFILSGCELMGVDNLIKTAKLHSDHNLMQKKSEKQIIIEKITDIISSHKIQNNKVEKLKGFLQNTTSQRIFFLDISCFLTKNNFNATLDFLHHKDFKLKYSAHKIGLDSKNYYLLKALQENKLSEHDKKYLNDLLEFYFPSSEKTLANHISWIQSDEYRNNLNKLFSFIIVPDEQIEVPSTEQNRFIKFSDNFILNSIRKISLKAKNVKTFFLGLGNKFGNALKRVYYYTISLPHTKKKEWFSNLKRKIKIFFGVAISIVVDVKIVEQIKQKILETTPQKLTENFTNFLKTESMKQILEFFASSNNSIKDLIANLNMADLASFLASEIIPVLDWAITAGLGAITFCLILNSIEQIKRLKDIPNLLIDSTNVERKKRK